MIGLLMRVSAVSLATSAQAENVGPYVILYLGVAASWVGVPIVGAGVLAAAGVLASEGELNLWLVIVVATVAAWTGGYGGYLLGARAGDALSRHPGRWQRKLYHAIGLGERLYRRWGRLALFLTPTWVSGALGMSRNTFLAWNALHAVVATSIATLGAYGVGSAILGQLSDRRGTIALAIAALTLTAIATAIWRRHESASNGEQQ
jgi:membrane protein DedA with SNARE-associated domain